MISFKLHTGESSDFLKSESKKEFEENKKKKHGKIRKKTVQMYGGRERMFSADIFILHGFCYHEITTSVFSR